MRQMAVSGKWQGVRSTPVRQAGRRREIWVSTGGIRGVSPRSPLFVPIS